jgi:methylenetetrahydrofolate dehydrogenase (NADP+)/methenyltetrahydrofolate cyclohydrolase
LTARVLDGRAIAAQIYEEVAKLVAERAARGGSRPKLATVLVGDDPASSQYVKLKQQNARQVGIESEDHRLSAQTTTEELLGLVTGLNGDESVSGILIQQPTPTQIDMARVVVALDPVKDVDGFHPFNAGLVALGLPGGVEPCTPAGIVELLERSGVAIQGANAVIVGRSNLVGKPTALLMLKRNATVPHPRGGHSGRCRGQVQLDQQGHGQAWRRGGRREHQLGAGSSGGRSGTGGGGGGRLADSKSGRRRADDPRHADQEHI